MDNIDQFSDIEILALTAVGESDSLGERGMQQTINTIMNRVSANLHWMGGDNARNVCLQKGQYNCWDQGTSDRQRIISIGLQNPTYGPYITALSLAKSGIAGELLDITNGAVNYVDGDAHACVHKGSTPCLVYGQRTFYNLKAVA
jgi:hypothetical protein